MRSRKVRTAVLGTGLVILCSTLAWLIRPTPVWACGNGEAHVSITHSGPSPVPVCGESPGWYAKGEPNPNDGTYSWGATLGTMSPTSGRESDFTAGSTGGRGEINVTYYYEDREPGHASTPITVVEAVGVEPDPLVMALGDQRSATAVTNPEGHEDRDFVSMTAEDLEVLWTWAGHITVTRSTAGTGTVTAHCGCSEASGTVKVVEVTSPLAVANATESAIEPNTYVACWVDDPNAYVEITATLNPSVSDQDAQWLLMWTGGEPHPTDPRKRLVHRNQATRTRVTATVGTSSASVTVLVVKLSWMKVWDAAEPNDFWRLNPPDANALYVPERTAWVLEGGCVYGQVSYAPTSAGPYVIAGYQGFSSAFQRLDPDTGTAPHYLFLWTPGDADRTYTLLAGVDVEGGDPNDDADPGDIDCQTVQITTKVVQIEPNLAVSGAQQAADPNDPNTYYAERADPGAVGITATLNPSCPDHEALKLLDWTGGEIDVTNPRRRWVSKATPDKTPVTGTVGSSSDSVDIIVVAVEIAGLTDGQDISVGRRAVLEAVILPTGIGLQADDHSWSIEGPVVSDYVVAGDHSRAEVIDLDPNDLQHPNVAFYWSWVDVVDFKEVSVDCRIEGTLAVTDEVTPEVKAPILNDWTSQTGTVDVTRFASVGWALHFGHPTDPNLPAGIRHSARVYGTGLVGLVQFVQLVDTRAALRLIHPNDPNVTQWFMKDTSGFMLDTWYPYPPGVSVVPGSGSTELTSSDRPHLLLGNSGDRAMVEYLHAEVFLMFKPDGTDSIWVPLGLLGWGYSGTAHSNDLGATWYKIDGDPFPVQWSPTTQFPEWEDIATPNHPSWTPIQ